jgi:nicotinate phosphoribosyltransferase
VISPLLTDLYQLTMAYGYWKLGMQDQEAVFQLIYRKNPFNGNYAVACGLAIVIEFLQDWHFKADDIAYLASLKTANGDVLFEPMFLDYLAELRFTCDVAAVPEGTIVFANEPLLRIKGPLLQGQLIESTLLNIINFQTLIATKASRICRAAKGETVLEFGMRRAQGPDGALSASRAAYVGGCHATSNVLAGKLYDIPVRGTHAHSWVTAFPDELSAFAAYAQVMPQNCVLLVDTYDTLTGVANAIQIGNQLRAIGAELLGIRLDSGDLAGLSIKARRMLDAAGFHNTQIIASNSLDENVIRDLRKAGARITVWGVGTNLATAYDQPALDGVYKLSALRNSNGEWQYKLKLSEQPAKTSNPGIYQVRRYFLDAQHVMDVLYDVELGIGEIPEMLLINDSSKILKLPDYDACVELLQPILEKGRLVATPESLHAVRERCIQQVGQFIKAHGESEYPVGLEKSLYKLKQELIAEFSAANTA